MAANDPPFRAEDLRGLYKEIQKAEYDEIPSHYSSDLKEVIKLLLQKNPRNRVDASMVIFWLF
jgi:NIMA (never in mitosis gene a)-related kinase 1/4/5